MRKIKSGNSSGILLVFALIFSVASLLFQLYVLSYEPPQYVSVVIYEDSSKKQFEIYEAKSAGWDYDPVTRRVDVWWLCPEGRPKEAVVDSGLVRIIDADCTDRILE